MKKPVFVTPEYIQRNTDIYAEYEQLRMEDGWYPNNKLENYHELVKLVDFTGVPISGTAILDVGCGTGDFSEFLYKRGVRRYVGIDILHSALEKARSKYPEETFLEGDILRGVVRSRFDYAFCSGALTMKIKDTDNYEFLGAMIKKMWQVTRIGLAFNVLTDEDEGDDDLFFYNKQKVLDLTKSLTNKEHVTSLRTPSVAQIHVYAWR